MRYRIAKRFSPQRFGLMWLAIAAVVGSAILISFALRIGTATLIIAPGLFLAVRWYTLSNTALMVDRSGVRVGEVAVPWESIAQLVVFGPTHRAAGAEAWVGVRLRPDAPLPPGVTLRGDPSAPQIHGRVRAEKLDVNRLAAKVHGFAPQVQVTERHGQPGETAAVPPAGTR
jgi:hypothetical protein